MLQAFARALMAGQLAHRRVIIQFGMLIGVRVLFQGKHSMAFLLDILMASPTSILRRQVKEEMEIGLPEIGAGDEALVCGLNSFWRSVAGAALKVRSDTRKMERWLLLSAFHKLCLGAEPTGIGLALTSVGPLPFTL